MTRVDLDRVWMQRSEANLPFVMRFVMTGRAPVSFLAREDSLPLQQNFRDHACRHHPVRRRYQPHLYDGTEPSAAISLTREELADAAEAITGTPFEYPLHTHIVRPTAASMARFRTLHSAVCQLAKITPDALANPASIKAMERELAHALVTCLTEQRTPTTKYAWANHRTMVGRLEDFLRERHYETVYLAEICAAIGVSEPTLGAVTNTSASVRCGISGCAG